MNKPGRCSDVIWENERDSEFISSLHITVKNEPGVLADISKIISSNNSNIDKVFSKNLDENFTDINVRVIVKDLENLNFLIKKLKTYKNATDVVRKMNE